MLLKWKNIAVTILCMLSQLVVNPGLPQKLKKNFEKCWFYICSIWSKQCGFSKLHFFRTWEQCVPQKIVAASAARRGHDMTFSSLTWCVAAALNKQVTTSIYQLRCNSKEKTVNFHASQVLIMGQIICSPLCVSEWFLLPFFLLIVLREL